MSAVPPSPENTMGGRCVAATQADSDSWLCMSAGSVTFVFGLALVMFLFATRPLWHTDLWDHANYGEYILQHGIPDTEPLLELAKGTPFIATAWLSQVGMALLLKTSWLGMPSLQFVHGILVMFAVGAVGTAVLRFGRSVTFAIVACCTFLAVNWQQLIVIRPQMVGVTCYCILAGALVSRWACERRGLLGLPLLFVLWANCHGSFSMGLMLIGLTAAGRFLDVYFRTGSISRAFTHRQCRNTLVLMLLCVLAVCANPFGVKIIPEVMRVGSHPNIATMFEWDAMSLKMKQGQAMAVSVVALLLLFCATSRRITVDELLRLSVTAVLALWSSRMVNWFAPMVAISIGVHGHAVWCRFQKRVAADKIRRPSRSRKSGWWTLVNVAVVLVFTAQTPLGKQTLGFQTPEIRELVSPQTPVELADFLATQHDPQDGLTFVPAEWAGYITHVVPDKLRLFVNLHVHVIPVKIWSDYIQLISSPSGAEAKLAEYGINTVVTDKSQQRYLIRQLDSSNEFRRLYEDQQAIVFGRRRLVE